MITKVKKIVKFFDGEFPFRKAEVWDKVGHTFGDINQPVTNIVVALDLTKEVFDEAIKTHSQLIITHHPFIFNPDIEKDFAEATYKIDLVDRIINTGISLLALHTNYDQSKKGTAYQVVKKLGFLKNSSFTKYGALVKIDIRLNRLQHLLESKLNLPIIETNTQEDKLYKSFGILPGSGSPEDIINLTNNGADIIITSDIKWSTWIMARELDIKLIAISHYVENVFVDHIANILNKYFKKIDVSIVNIGDV